MTQEALKELLEAVEAAIHAGDWKVDGACDPDLVIRRAKEALAQPEQEPVAWANKDDLQNFDMRVRTNCDLMHTVPLYTAPPPQRQWVGLTDEEMVDLQDRCGISIHQSDFEAIEAKLREKNTYETPSDSAA